MKGGYNIYWTENALDELAKTIEYLEVNFSDSEIHNLVSKIENITGLISKNPDIFPKSEYKDVYRIVILKFNTLYYKINKNNIEVLSFFSNRQSPKSRKI